MTIATTIDAIQAVLAANSDIIKAPLHNEYPGTLPTAHLPIAITTPDSGEAYNKGMGYDMHDAVYRVSVYVTPTEQGRGIQEGWNKTIDVMQTVLDDLLDADNSLLSTGSYQAYIRPSADSPIIHNGLEVIAYPPQAQGIDGYPHYFGFTFLVRVNEQWSQT